MKIVTALALACIMSGSAALAQVAPAQRLGVEAHVQRAAGAGAVSCGSFVPPERNVLPMTSAEHAEARQCMLRAWTQGLPFYLIAQGTSVDSSVASGVIGRPRRGGLERFGYDSAPCGGPGCAESFHMRPCRAVVEPAAMDLYDLCGLLLAPRAVAAQPAPRPEPPRCEFRRLQLPADFALVAVGGKGYPLRFAIDDSGRPAQIIDVKVSRTDLPVVLVLGAREPTIWNVEQVRGSRVVAVLAGGRHRQALAGLDVDVPALIATRENRSACGQFVVEPAQRAQVDAWARRFFGRGVDALHQASRAEVTIGPAGVPRERWIPYPAITWESFRDRGNPPAALALQAALMEGVLRPATGADAEAWVDAVLAELRRDGEVARGAVERPFLGSGVFVMLKPFTFPARSNILGLYVPKGLPRPGGDPGPAHVYDFNAVRCGDRLCPTR